jgi:hypothetical protein
LQAEARDQHLKGIRDLYSQYDECVHTIRNMRGQGPRQPPDLDFAAATNDVLRLKEQELQAAQALLRERDEEIEEKLREIQEKGQAHTSLSKQATSFGQENEELKRQLQATQDSLQAKSAEVERLTAELRHLREAAQGGASSSTSASMSKSIANSIELPEVHHLDRKVTDVGLTCIAAARGQGSPLPESLLAIGTAAGKVMLLDGQTMKIHAHIKPSREETGSIVAVDVSESGQLLAASSDHVLRLVDLRAQKLMSVMRGHNGAVSACGFLKGGSTAFTASMDRTLKIWDLQKGQTLRSLPASCPVTSSSVHHSSGLIVVGHADGSLAVFDHRASDVASAPLSATSAIHQGCAVVGIRIAPDARSILSQAEDGTICITALDTMRTLHRLSGLGAVVGPSSPAFSPDGAYVLARSTESICCWCTSDGEKVCTSDAKQTVCVCWDLARAVTAHSDGHAILWGKAATENTE